MALRHSAFSVAAALVLCTCPYCANGKLASPGDSDYWVKLKSLAASEGKLEPAFTPDVTDYTLKVDDNEIKSLSLTFELDLAKYDPIEMPKLYFDGEVYEYSPVDTLTERIQLDESIGPVDKVYTIKVADPSGAKGWPIPAENGKEYRVHILQPPDFKAVIKAVKIQAFTADASKTKVSQDPVFNPLTKAYHFKLPKGHDQVKLQMNCTQFATGMKFDGQAVEINSTQSLTLTSATKDVNAQCVYDDPQWTSVALQKTYALSFEQQIEIDIEHFSVSLNISAEQGYCVMRPGMGKAKKEMGFVCRFKVSRPNFMALITDKALAVVLERGSTHTPHNLPVGLPVPIAIPSKRTDYTLRVLGSELPLQYPVVTIRAGDCSTMTCPAGTLPKTEIMSIENSQAYLCAAEKCSQQDIGRCCKDAPRCTTLTDEDLSCPAETHIDMGRSCHHEPCGMEDLAHCCVKGLKPDHETHEHEHEHEHEHHDHKNWKLRHHLHMLIRHKMEWYRRLGCGPTGARLCSNQMCYYDETCVSSPPRLGGLGCFAGGIAMRCRYCGFAPYEQCPEWYDCSGPCHAWTTEHLNWCNKNYDVHCPEFLHHVEFWQNSTGAAAALLHGGGSSVAFTAGIGAAVLAAALMAAWRLDFVAGWRRQSAEPGTRDVMISQGEAETLLAE